MQPRAQHELMRRHAHHRAKRAQEVIWAHRCLARELGERQRLVRLRLDPAQRVGDAALVAPARPVRTVAHAGKRRADRAGKAQRQIFELPLVALVARGLRNGEQRHERGQRRQARDGERGPPRTRQRGRDRFQMVGREVEGEAAVAGSVLMAAFEARSLVAEQQGARAEQGRALSRSVLECAVRHDRDAGRVVPFFERPIVRAGSADHIADAPARARGQEARVQCHYSK